MFSKLRIFTGNANRALAIAVSNYAAIPLGDAKVFKFANDNSFVKINENVRGSDVFILQPTSRPVDDNLMELLIMIDALKELRQKPLIVLYRILHTLGQIKKINLGLL